MTDWTEFLMGFARHAATKSKDSTKVGAVLVDPDRCVLLTAFNGPPKGVGDTPDRFERPRKYLFASHAEANLIAFAARRGIRTEGCSVYVTHPCCAACARTLIQAGIRQVVCEAGEFGGASDAWKAETEAAEQMFEESNVGLRRYIAGAAPWARP